MSALMKKSRHLDDGISTEEGSMFLKVEYTWSI